MHLNERKVSAELEDLFFTDVTTELGQLSRILVQSIVNGETVRGTVAARRKVKVGNPYLILIIIIRGGNYRPVTL